MLERCYEELEQMVMHTSSTIDKMRPVVQESPHPYPDANSTEGRVKISGYYHCCEITEQCHFILSPANDVISTNAALLFDA